MQFYDSIFTEWFSWCPRLDGLSLDSTGGGGQLVGETLLRMMRSFEVTRPRDGFTMGFFFNLVGRCLKQTS